MDSTTPESHKPTIIPGILTFQKLIIEKPADQGQHAEIS